MSTLISGQATFVRCVSTNNLETNFRQVIQSLNQRLFQLGLEEFGFKAALASCSSKAVVLSKKTPQCIAYVLTTNPYPKFNSSGLQTVRSLQKIYDCLVEGASRTRIAGDNIIGALKERLPQELQYLLPNMVSELMEVLWAIWVMIGGYNAIRSGQVLLG